jgi:L-aminoadipate-semialdehyde dehydrogenase
MPLNPNGKIDKPALPFPDTAQAPSIDPRVRRGSSVRREDPTEEAIRSIWSSILSNAPVPIPLDESFFDLGGHSILATRLIFELRKVFVVDAPLGLVFERPTVGGLATAINAIRNADLGFGYKQDSPAAISTAFKPQKPSVEYGQDYEKLVKELKPSYQPLPPSFGSAPVTVFLTGATGFLGAFILRDLLARKNEVAQVLCLVRASDSEKALQRLRQGGTDRGVWDEEWTRSSRLEVIHGDLDQKQFGMDSETWNRVAAESDIILHNGALVSGFPLFNLF